MFFLHVLYIKYKCFRENQNDTTRFNPTTKGLRNQNMFIFWSYWSVRTTYNIFKLSTVLKITSFRDEGTNVCFSFEVVVVSYLVYLVIYTYYRCSWPDLRIISFECPFMTEFEC